MTFGRLVDGMVTSDVMGRTIRIFKPRWWQVWREVRWFLSTTSDTTFVVWSTPVEGGKRAHVAVRCFVLPLTYTAIKSPPDAKAKRR